MEQQNYFIMAEAFLQNTLRANAHNNQQKSCRLTNKTASSMQSTKPTTASMKMILSMQPPISCLKQKGCQLKPMSSTSSSIIYHSLSGVHTIPNLFKLLKKRFIASCNENSIWTFLPVATTRYFHQQPSSCHVPQFKTREEKDVQRT